MNSDAGLLDRGGQAVDIRKPDSHKGGQSSWESAAVTLQSSLRVPFSSGVLLERATSSLDIRVHDLVTHHAVLDDSVSQHAFPGITGLYQHTL